MAANPLTAPGMGVLPDKDMSLPIKARGGAMPAGVPDMAAPAAPTTEEWQRRSEQAYKPVEEAAGRESEAQQKYLGEKARLTRQEAEQYGGKVSELYKTAEAEKAAMPFPEFHPTQDNTKDIIALNSLIGVLGVALGAGSKSNAVGAMNAMSGMMDGYKAGRADLMEREKAEFDRNVKNIAQHHKAIGEKLKQGLEMAATDREASQAKIDEAIAESQSAYLKAVRDRQGAVEAYKKWMDLGKGVASAQAKAAATPAKTAEAKLGTAGVRRHIFDVTGKTIPTDKEGEAISNTVIALDQVASLRERLKDPEIETGLRALPAAFIQKLTSLFNQPVTEGQLRNLLDAELTGNDKTTLFVKDAILAGFKIEQGLTGTRVPVFTQKMVGPILDPRAYKPKTYDALLASREEELKSIAESRGIYEDDLKKLMRVKKPVAPKAKGTADDPIKLD